MPLSTGELPFLLSEAIYQVDLTSLGIFIPRQCVPAFPFCPSPMPYMSHTSQNKLPLYHHSGVLRALSAPPSGEIWTLYTAFGRGGPHSSLRHLPRSLFFHPLLRALALSPRKRRSPLGVVRYSSRSVVGMSSAFECVRAVHGWGGGASCIFKRAAE